MREAVFNIMEDTLSETDHKVTDHDVEINIASVIKVISDMGTAITNTLLARINHAAETATHAGHAGVKAMIVQIQLAVRDVVAREQEEAKCALIRCNRAAVEAAWKKASEQELARFAREEDEMQNMENNLKAEEETPQLDNILEASPTPQIPTPQQPAIQNTTPYCYCKQTTESDETT